MTDNEKRAHDIAVRLLPESLKYTNSQLFLYDKAGNAEVNSMEIVDAYLELYSDILKEINYR